MSLSRLLCLAALALLYPQLPGAGCRAHHAAPITADIGGGSGDVIVVYFQRDTWDDCPTGAECLHRPERWGGLRDCAPRVESAPGSDVVRVQGCTPYIGVDYAIDVMAVEDRNGNGRLDPGERYGLWDGGPLVRAREKTVGAIRITIDRTLAIAPGRP